MLQLMNRMNSSPIVISKNDGDSLIGTYFFNPRPKGLVISCPALGHSRTALKIYQDLPYVGHLRGYDTLQFDFTGLGQSSGDFSYTTISSQIEDLGIILNEFNLNIKLTPTFLIGHGTGGIVASQSYTPSLKGLVLWNSPIDMKRLHELYRAEVENKGFVMRERQGKQICIGEDMWKEFGIISHRYIAFQNMPTLYLAGSKDSTVNASDFAKIYFGNEKRCLAEIVEGADQDFEIDPFARKLTLDKTFDWIDLYNQ